MNELEAMSSAADAWLVADPIMGWLVPS